MKQVAVIGGGPAGLMAAQVLVDAGVVVHLFDAMPSVGRKFLLAGKGGLNLTHSEDADRFASRYQARRPQVERLLQVFGPAQLRAWAQGLGIETFIGTSGRVFPVSMKAAPLLRAWLHRLRYPQGVQTKEAEEGGVHFHMRHRWLGWAADGHTLRFETPQGDVEQRFDAVVLALGGGSWARLGSNGAWLPLLAARGIQVAPLLPANCGFDVASSCRSETTNSVGWSAHFTSRFAGQPFKSVAIAYTSSSGQTFQRKGEFVATQTGVEGSLIYAASSLLRDDILAQGQATLWIDLLPDRSADKVLAEVSHPRGSRSLSSHLKSRLGLEGIKMALLYEILSKEDLLDHDKLARAIKALPLHLVAARPLDEAISSAGGVQFEALDHALMCQTLPGVFCAGEMLDWEAPTGGYLLTTCFSSGKVAGQGVVSFLQAAA